MSPVSYSQTYRDEASCEVMPITNTYDNFRKVDCKREGQPRLTGPFFVSCSLNVRERILISTSSTVQCPLLLVPRTVRNFQSAGKVLGLGHRTLRSPSQPAPLPHGLVYSAQRWRSRGRNAGQVACDRNLLSAIQPLSAWALTLQRLDPEFPTLWLYTSLGPSGCFGGMP